MNEPVEVEVNGGPGCLFFFAAIIIGIAVGNIYQAAYGWLVIGVIFLIWALAACNGRTR
jgi:hypothetical protein